jgi:hypothetical protein
MFLFQVGVTYSPIILKYYRLSADLVVYFVIFLAFFSFYKRASFVSYFKFLLLNVCISAILEIISMVLVKINFHNTLFVNHIYLIQEALTCGLFFIYLFKKTKLEILVKYSVLLLLIGIFLNAFINKGYLFMPSRMVLAENIIFILFSIYYLNDQIKSTKNTAFRTSSLFLFIFYILISNVTMVLFSLFYDSALKTSDNLAMQFHIGKNIISFICYFIWIYATLKLKTAKPTATPKP